MTVSPGQAGPRGGELWIRGPEAGRLLVTPRGGWPRRTQAAHRALSSAYRPVPPSPSVQLPPGGAGAAGCTVVTWAADYPGARPLHAAAASCERAAKARRRNWPPTPQAGSSLPGQSLACPLPGWAAAAEPQGGQGSRGAGRSPKEQVPGLPLRSLSLEESSDLTQG